MNEKTSQQKHLRQLPSVDKLLNHTGCRKLLELYRRDLVVNTIRKVLEQCRARLAAEGSSGSLQASTGGDLKVAYRL